LFFQAEDGIRGRNVTGVQTCALPISLHRLQLTDRQKGCIQGVKDVNSFDEKEISLVTEAGTLSIKGEGLHVTRLDLEKQEVDIEIGRASCRERGSSWGGRVSTR